MNFDFAAIQGSALNGSTEDFNAAGFLAAYARGMMNGKPVAWLRFGTPVGSPPAPAGLKNHLEAEIAKWGPVIRKAGIYAD